MASFRFLPGKRPGAGANALARALFLPACVVLGGLIFAGVASAAHSSEAEAQEQMRAECMALHEEMKASMMEGGMEMDQGKMSPEMIEEYRKCMEAMPKMREMCM